MEATVQQKPVFNPIQLHLLKMFSVDRAEQGLWDNGELDQARLDEINQMDLHHLD